MGLSKSDDIDTRDGNKHKDQVPQAGNFHCANDDQDKSGCEDFEGLKKAGSRLRTWTDLTGANG